MKPCPSCKRHLRVALPSSVAFNRKADTEDGLQPWCRTCDWHGKATLDEAWNCLRRFLEKSESSSLLLWTKESYLSLVGDDPSCQWCGARCREWTMGHWLDRQSSKSGHVPSNCVVCCTPCNMHKGHKPSQVHEAFLRSLLAPSREFPSGQGRHPWGKIPWDDYPSSSKTFSRRMPPDLSAHVVPDPQMRLAI